MEKDILNRIKWEDYLPVGLAVAIYMSYLDLPRDNLFLLVPVVVFFLITGIKNNLKALVVFFAKCWPLIAGMIIYMVYYGFINNHPDSLKFSLSSLGLILAGFMAAVRSKRTPAGIYMKMWLFLMAVLVLDIIRMTAYSRGSCFVAYQVELEAVLILVCITFLFMQEKVYMISGGIVSVLAAIFSLKNSPIIFRNALALKGIIPAYLSGDIKQKLLGRGFFLARFETPDFCENTFSAFFYDFGLLGLLLYLAVLIFAIVMLIIKKDSFTRKQAILVIVMLAGSAFYSMEIWSNIMFMIYTIIGILLGQAIKD